jgi:hypothetical protein
MTPAELQFAIASSPRACRRVRRYLRALGIAMPPVFIGALALSAVCGVTPRTWRRWVSGERRMPKSARRLVEEVSGVCRRKTNRH